MGHRAKDGLWRLERRGHSGGERPSGLDRVYNNSAGCFFEVKGKKDSTVSAVVDIAILLMRSCDGRFLCRADVEIKVD